MVEGDYLVDEAVPLLAFVPGEIVDLDEEVDQHKSVVIAAFFGLSQYGQSIHDHLIVLIHLLTRTFNASYLDASQLLDM